jgi:hypothetical protein
VIPKVLLKIAKVAWITLTVLVLFVSLYGFDAKPNSDIGIFFVWSMLILAFPSSLLVALFFTGLSIAIDELFSAVIPTSYWSLSVGWVCFFVAGYWQWFVLLPWLWRKWKTRRTAGTVA